MSWVKRSSAEFCLKNCGPFFEWTAEGLLPMIGIELKLQEISTLEL
jgi:hypothetical protein